MYVILNAKLTEKVINYWNLLMIGARSLSSYVCLRYTNTNEGFLRRDAAT